MKAVDSVLWGFSRLTWAQLLQDCTVEFFSHASGMAPGMKGNVGLFVSWLTVWLFQWKIRFFFSVSFLGCFTEVHGFQDVIQCFRWFLWRNHPLYAILYFIEQSRTAAILYSLQFFSFFVLLFCLFLAVCQFLCTYTKSWNVILILKYPNTYRVDSNKFGDAFF